MTPAQYQLLQTLQAGPQAGPQLGTVLNISRAGVWKLIDQLRHSGIAITADQHGYHLPSGLHLLDTQAIADAHTKLAGHGAALSGTAIDTTYTLAILPHTDSTNQVLWQTPAEHRHRHVVVAETQSAGRGRRGRSWYSPPCSNIYFSLGWRFDCGVGALGLLSTQVAVCAAAAVMHSCHADIGLKWPNDLYLRQPQQAARKLGGILIELQATPDGPSEAVIGIGINVALPADAPIDQAYASLREVDTTANRNTIIGTLIYQLQTALSAWPDIDPNAILEHWYQHDILRGQTIKIWHHQAPSAQASAGTTEPEPAVVGEYVGVDHNGGLQVVIDGQLKVLHSGEVSVRHA